MANQVLIADASGNTQTVSEKAFEMIYAPKGYTKISLVEANEISSEVGQSALEDTGSPSDSGQSGAAVGSGTRKPNKAKNPKRT